MAETGLPCLDLLEATPAILRGLMTELTEEDARWKPGPERFSVAEVLAHLSHSEGHCYRMRLNRFMAAQMYLDLLFSGADQFRDLSNQAGAGPMAASYHLKP